MRLPPALTLLALLLPLQVFAADPGPPPPTPPPAAPADMPPPPPPPPPAAEPDNACVPACRSGYFCQDGTCIVSDAPTNSPVVGVEPGDPGSNPLINSRGERAPMGQHWELKRKMGLLITGPILFGVGYGFAVFIALTSSSGSGQGVRLLNFVPLAGPALSLAALVSNSGTNLITTSGLFVELLYTVVDTALQITGLTLALIGIPRREVLVDDPEGYRRPAEPRRPNDPDAPPAKDSNLPPIQWSFAPVGPGGSLGFTFALTHW